MGNEAYSKSADDVVKELESNKEKGLTYQEVGKRKVVYGLNEIKAEKKINPLVIFLNQFKSFIIYILIFAVILSFIIKEYTDASVILVILIFNAFFGFIQEYKAEKSIEALKKLAALKARVVRNGKIDEIDSKDLVPGDIVILEEGDKIPADARLIEAVSMRVLESSLTGESEPTSKNSDKLAGDLAIADRKNMVFSGTAITKGRGKAVVVGTGMNSEMGKIAHMITGVKKELTPLQKKLEKLGRVVGVIALLVSLFIFITEIIEENLTPYLLSGEFLQFFIHAKSALLTAVALAVAAVPEGLPAVVTITLAIGTRRMLKRNSLVRHLPSVETLGETNVICSDKTGTITKNEMTIRKAYANLKDLEVSGEGYDLQGKVTIDKKLIGEKELFLFKSGILCNNASLNVSGSGVIGIIGDPTEAALLVSAAKAGIDNKKLNSDWKRLDEEPFDSNRKMMSTLNQSPNKKQSFVFTKGAPERVLEKCTRILVNGKIIKLRKEMIDQIHEKNKEYSERALRVLGFAYKEYKKGSKFEEDLIFIGLQGMIDPPRAEVKEAVSKCQDAGIRVIMVTGDNKYTAKAIANEVGISGESMEGIEFMKLDEKEQFKKIEEIGIFARVEPEHKMRIVEILQQRGSVVAMTGDGVNDAPALKKADIGVAMGIKGTDVAKEASDMVLQDDNFASIVNSVEEGRGIYENIKKFVNYLFSCNIAEVLIIFTALILKFPLPLTAIMLLWINLVTDGLPALSLSVDNNPKDLMKRKPKKKDEKILNKGMMFNVIFDPIIITFSLAGLIFWAVSNYGLIGLGLQLERMQTLAFVGLILMELVRLQVIRSEYKLGLFSNKYVLMAIASSIILTLAVMYTPFLSTKFGVYALSLGDWIAVAAAAVGFLILSVIGVFVKRKIIAKAD